VAGEISTNPAWRARRRRRVLGPLLLGLTLLALAGWAYAAQAAATRRAVTTTAVIDEVHQGPFHDSQTGERTFEVVGAVRYVVDGTAVRATVTLVRRCDGSALCLRRYQPGDQVAVAYDPDRTSDAALAIDRHGRYPLPGPLVLVLGLLAGLSLTAAIVVFVLGQ
jgi:hypothetical protein